MTLENLFGELSLEATQQDVLAALQGVLTVAHQGDIALDAATLAALENVTTVISGDVALDAATVAALQDVVATISGTVSVQGSVGLDVATLAALENITVTVGNASLAVTGPLTNTELRATPLPVDTDLDQPLTDAQLRASRVPVDVELDQPLTDVQLRAAAVAVADGGASLTVDGPLTNVELRAGPVDVNTGLAQALTDAQLRSQPVEVDAGLDPLTDAQLRATPLVVDTALDQPLTDTQLRATRVPVDVELDQPLTDTQLRAAAVLVSDGGGSLTVDGPLTDTQLRAAPVPVSLSAPLSVSDAGGSLTVDAVDGGLVSLGATTDLEAAANGSLIAVAKRLRALLAAGLPVSLSSLGALQVANAESVSREVSGSGSALDALVIPATEVKGRTISVHLTGTFVATITHEASNDGVSWTSQAGISTANTAGSPTTADTVSGTIRVFSVAAKWFRSRVSAYTSGTVIATAVLSAVPHAFQGLAADTELPTAATLADSTANPTVPAVGSFPHWFSGSTWARAVGAVDNADAQATAASLNKLLSVVRLQGFNGTTWDRIRTGGLLGSLLADVQASTPTVVSGTGAALDATPIPSTEVRGRWVSVQIVGTFTATNIFEQSNDGTNWVPVVLNQAVSTFSLQSSSGATGVLWQGAVTGRFFRVRISAYTSGTVSAVAVFSPLPGQVYSAVVDTELPAASALADDTTNPTTTSVGAHLLAYDGATWDRVRTAGAMGDDNAGPLGTGLYGFGGTVWDRIRTARGLGDASSGANSPLATGLYHFNGANWDRVRTPNVFKTATATASGDTAVWTPASGKKFRLLRYSIQITSDAAQAVGGAFDIILRDATTGLAFSFSSFVPGIAGSTFGNTNQTGWTDLGNGYVSSAANAVLNVNLSAALTSGKVRVVVVGTEE